jgi:hypothetical protein
MVGIVSKTDLLNVEMERQEIIRTVKKLETKGEGA